MQLTQRTVRAGSLHGLGVVLRALALVVAFLSLGLTGCAPAPDAGPTSVVVRSDDAASLAPAAPRLPADTDAALLESADPQELSKGKSKGKARDAKQAGRDLQVQLDAARSLAQSSDDERPFSSVRLVAHPSRAPPRC